MGKKHATDLVIEGDAEALEWLSARIDRQLASANLERVTSQATDELREPILIGLIVALGGPVVAKGIVSIVEQYLKHVEAMKALQTKDREAGFQHVENMTKLKFKYVHRDDTEESVDFNRVRNDAA